MSTKEKPPSSPSNKDGLSEWATIKGDSLVINKRKLSEELEPEFEEIEEEREKKITASLKRLEGLSGKERLDELCSQLEKAKDISSDIDIDELLEEYGYNIFSDKEYFSEADPRDQACPHCKENIMPDGCSHVLKYINETFDNRNTIPWLIENLKKVDGNADIVKGLDFSRRRIVYLITK